MGNFHQYKAHAYYKGSGAAQWSMALIAHSAGVVLLVVHMDVQVEGLKTGAVEIQQQRPMPCSARSNIAVASARV